MYQGILERSSSAVTPIPAEASNRDWCVGEEPVQWDVSFTDRLLRTLRGLVSRGPVVVGQVEVGREREAA